MCREWDVGVLGPGEVGGGWDKLVEISYII